MDFIGASLSTRCDTDLAYIRLTLLQKKLDEGLKLLADLVTGPTFPQAEVEKQKQSVLASIKAKRDNPRQIARDKFYSALFPGSPYGRPVEGTETSVKGIEQKHLVDFYQRFYIPNRAILVVVGDTSHEETTEKLTAMLPSWRKGTLQGTSPPKVLAGTAKIIPVHKKLTQANIVMGHESVTRSNPNYYSLRVLNHILGGGGLSSRLADTIRNERGLAYSIYSHFSSGELTGRFQISMQTKNKTAGEAIPIVREEIHKIRAGGVTEKELQEAKDYLTGSFPLRLDTNRRVARFLGEVEYFGLGLDYMERFPSLIRKVTREDVLRAARKHLTPEKLITVVVADLEKAKVRR